VSQPLPNPKPLPETSTDDPQDDAASERAAPNQSTDSGQDQANFPPIRSVIQEAFARELHEAFERIDKDHFVSVEGGKTFVFKEAYDHEISVPSLERMTTTAFTQLHAREQVRVLKGFDDEGNPKIGYRAIATHWLNHPNGRTYQNGLALLPDAKKVPYGVYNLWRGWGCVPNLDARTSDVGPALLHIYLVICGANKAYFLYVINWMASAIQNPERQAEVAIVLIGGRGGGKGTLGRWLRELFGSHGLQITHPRHLTGNFNAHLRSTLFAFVDEAFFAGDKAGNSVLKALITEPEVAIEKKKIDVFGVRNRLKILMATNDAHAVLAGEDERRYFVLEVSDIRKQDHDYFARLNKWWNTGGKEALLGFLMRRDLSNFEIRKIPYTKALEDQKTASLDSVDKWLFGVLSEGAWTDWKDWTTEVPRKVVFESLERYMNVNRSLHVKTTPEAIGKRLRKRMTVNNGQESTGSRRKTWLFPELEDARKQFADSLRLKHLDWSNI
jgi:hypothetical protein